jgi:DNA-binding NarL/FixJ family response regulator
MKASKVDVIVLDMTIPGASSQEVVVEAVKAHPNTRFVLTSAYSQETIAHRVCAAQVVSFIRKPFRIGDLVQTVRNALCL